MAHRQPIQEPIECQDQRDSQDYQSLETRGPVYERQCDLVEPVDGGNRAPLAGDGECVR